MAEPSTGSPIHAVLARWHRFVAGDDPGALDELLADDVVFYSPIVYTPQRGKAITTAYLRAAGSTLGGTVGTGGGNDGGFRYTNEVVSGDTAVLEFETSLGGTYVNGVDIVRCNDSGQIVEFRVMVRPLQAVNAVHAAMQAMLESMRGA